MKRMIILINLVLLTLTYSIAQVPNSIAELEYYFDQHVAYGQGEKLTPNDSGKYTLPLSELEPGSHTLYLRAKSNTGAWSVTSKKVFYLAHPANYAISGIEYFIDEFKSPGKGSFIPVNNSDSYVIPISGLGEGLHILYMRLRTVENEWGKLSKKVFYVRENSKTGIDRLEYFYTGAEEFVSSTFSYKVVSNSDAINLNTDVSELSANQEYTIHVTPIDSAGKRGYTESCRFVLIENVAPLANQTNITLDMYAGDSVALLMDTLFNDINLTNGDKLSYEIKPDGSENLMTFTTWKTDSLLWFKPGLVQSGTYNAWLKATDLFGESDSVWFTLSVGQLNHAPHALQSHIYVDVNEGEEVFFNMDTLFNDIDIPVGDSLIYEMVKDVDDIPQFLSWASVHQLSVKPLDGDAGAYTFWLKATDKAGVSDSLQVSLTVDEVTGIGPHNFSQNVKIFPNPSQCCFTISLDVQQPVAYTLHVFNVTGTKILSRDVAQNGYQLDLTELPKGIYGLTILYANKVITKQLILE
jgi:hypothetical protein